MTYTYSLVVIDENGEAVVDREITPDQAVKLIAEALSAKESEPRPVTVLDRLKSADDLPAPSKRGRKKSRRCSNCGQPGHTTRTCTNGGPKEEHPSVSEDKFSEDQYNEVRSRKEAGEGSWEIAEAMSVSRKQVNIAFQASTFDRYQMIAARE